MIDYWPLVGILLVVAGFAARASQHILFDPWDPAVSGGVGTERPPILSPGVMPGFFPARHGARRTMTCSIALAFSMTRGTKWWRLEPPFESLIIGRVFMVLVLVLVSATAAAASNPPVAASPLTCPDQHLLAKDLSASRAAHQPQGASQSGSPWIPVDALLPRTIAERRDFMLRAIKEQLESRRSTFAVADLDRVLGVMRGIDREKFLDPAQRAAAYLPVSLDIGFCQTLSDAYIIALMISAAPVGPGANVLDVGTGSGYQAAILSRLARHVQSVEIVPQLALQARRRLRHMGYHNIAVVAADGYAGWPPRAPFDVILVAAGSTSIPRQLLDQLKPGGHLIMPVGPTALEEELVLAAKSQTGVITRCTLGLAAFVPMTGQAQGATHAAAPGKASTAPGGLQQCYEAPVT